MIKYLRATVLHNVIDRSIQTHGALGYPPTALGGDVPWARAARIYDGPDEVPANRGTSRVEELHADESH